MTSRKDTYEYCEQLIDEQINSLIGTAHLCKEGDALVGFKQDLKDLYKHLENIQNMKNSYISGR